MFFQELEPWAMKTYTYLDHVDQWIGDANNVSESCFFIDSWALV